jgi:carbonyl reductase 1
LAAAWGTTGTVYLTGRDRRRVEAATADLADRGLAVAPERIDVTDPASIDRFADMVRREHGGLDVVVSNAAARISPDRPPGEQVRTFVATNNRGTTRGLRSFLPLLRDDGRLLVVASSFGTLRSLPASLHHLFDDPSLTLDDLDTTMASYVDDVERGRTDRGWPEWINIPSKVGQVAAMRVAAREARAEGRDVLVAAICPGLVDTGASRPWFDDMTPAQSPDEAAGHLTPLALGPRRHDIHGQLVQFGRILPWR